MMAKLFTMVGFFLVNSAALPLLFARLHGTVSISIEAVAVSTAALLLLTLGSLLDRNMLYFCGNLAGLVLNLTLLIGSMQMLFAWDFVVSEVHANPCLYWLLQQQMVKVNTGDDTACVVEEYLLDYLGCIDARV